MENIYNFIKFVDHLKMLSFQVKIRILENLYLYHSLGSFQTLFKTSDESSGDINKCNFLTSCNELCQHLKDPNNSANQYFPNCQCMML